MLPEEPLQVTPAGAARPPSSFMATCQPITVLLHFDSFEVWKLQDHISRRPSDYWSIIQRGGHCRAHQSPLNARLYAVLELAPFIPNTPPRLRTGYGCGAAPDASIRPSNQKAQESLLADSIKVTSVLIFFPKSITERSAVLEVTACAILTLSVSRTFPATWQAWAL